MLNRHEMRSLVNKKSKESKLPPQQLYGLYAMDRLILKLSNSTYSNDLIVKGGFLLTTHLGINSRVTRDMDFTIKNIPLSEEVIDDFISVIESDDTNSPECFKVRKVMDIRSDFEYGGYSLMIDYFNGKTKVPITVDLTTGEDLISINEHQHFKSIFTDESYSLSSYTVEQVVVDKFYTLLAYGAYDDKNSRMKDYYDLYLINKLEQNLDYSLVNKGLDRTMKQRDTFIKNDQYNEITDYLHDSEMQKGLWKSYSKRTPYASELSFDSVMEEIKILSSKLINQRQTDIEIRRRNSRRKFNDFER